MPEKKFLLKNWGGAFGKLSQDLNVGEQQMNKISKFRLAWRGARNFSRRAGRDKSIVFFAEGRGYWKFLGPVIDFVTIDYGREIHYITADINDPVLIRPPPKIRSYYIGSGIALIYTFHNLRAATLVTTTPDLNTYYLKRSVHSVHYVRWPTSCRRDS